VGISVQGAGYISSGTPYQVGGLPVAAINGGVSFEPEAIDTTEYSGTGAGESLKKTFTKDLSSGKYLGAFLRFKSKTAASANNCGMRVYINDVRTLQLCNLSASYVTFSLWLGIGFMKSDTGTDGNATLPGQLVSFQQTATDTIKFYTFTDSSTAYFKDIEVVWVKMP